MKKILSVALCVIIALTLSVAAMAVSSPENKVIIRKGIATKQDGSNIPVDTFVEVAEDNTVTVTADEKTYGKFNKWTIYVVKTVDGSDKVEYVEAKEGVDYVIVSGSLNDSTLVIKPINQIAIAGNYAGTVTDPAKASSVPGTTPKSVKTGDVNAIYAVIVMLAAGAVAFGVKRKIAE